MKSKILMALFFGLVLTGCARVPGVGDGPSFRTQMCELVQLREAGEISEKEYKVSKKRIFSIMVH